MDQSLRKGLGKRYKYKKCQAINFEGYEMGLLKGYVPTFSGGEKTEKEKARKV
jgi:hypothetical protein